MEIEVSTIGLESVSSVRQLKEGFGASVERDGHMGSRARSLLGEIFFTTAGKEGSTRGNYQYGHVGTVAISRVLSDAEMHRNRASGRAPLGPGQLRAYREPSVSDRQEPKLEISRIRITHLCRRACSRKTSDLGLSNEKE